MKGKGKKFIIGVVLAAIGAIGLLGMFGEAEDRAALLFGSLLFVAAGTVLIFLDKKLPDKPKSTSQPSIAFSAPVSNKKTFSFKVAGVTFNNGRKSRQAILRKIKWGDEPFDGEVQYTLKEYDFDGSPAIGVYANGEQIGNVPKDALAFVLNCMDSISNVSAMVYGGGQAENGENRYFGAKITIEYLEKTVTIGQS